MTKNNQVTENDPIHNGTSSDTDQDDANKYDPNTVEEDDNILNRDDNDDDDAPPPQQNDPRQQQQTKVNVHRQGNNTGAPPQQQQPQQQGSRTKNWLLLPQQMHDVFGIISIAKLLMVASHDFPCVEGFPAMDIRLWKHKDKLALYLLIDNAARDVMTTQIELRPSDWAKSQIEHGRIIRLDQYQEGVIPRDLPMSYFLLPLKLWYSVAPRLFPMGLNDYWVLISSVPNPLGGNRPMVSNPAIGCLAHQCEPVFSEDEIPGGICIDSVTGLPPAFDLGFLYEFSTEGFRLLHRDAHREVELKALMGIDPPDTVKAARWEKMMTLANNLVLVVKNDRGSASRSKSGSGGEVSAFINKQTGPSNNNVGPRPGAPKPAVEKKPAAAKNKKGRDDDEDDETRRPAPKSKALTGSFLTEFVNNLATMSTREEQLQITRKTLEKVREVAEIVENEGVTYFFFNNQQAYRAFKTLLKDGASRLHFMDKRLVTPLENKIIEMREDPKIISFSGNYMHRLYECLDIFESAEPNERLFPFNEGLTSLLVSFTAAWMANEQLRSLSRLGRSYDFKALEKAYQSKGRIVEYCFFEALGINQEQYDDIVAHNKLFNAKIESLEAHCISLIPLKKTETGGGNNNGPRNNSGPRNNKL